MASERLSRRALLAVIVVAITSLALDRVFGRDGISVSNGGRLAVETVSLPDPKREGDVSVEEAIANRRSRREYGDVALERDELSQLLWSMQGVTEDLTGHRAAPSAGGLYPLELYVILGDPGVEGLEAGIYQYRHRAHELALLERGNVQADLRAAAVDQEAVELAAIDVVVAAVDERTTQKYGRRGELRYVPMEAGHAGENLYLQAEALALSTVSIGAFSDERVRDILQLPENERPLYIFPVGVRS
ncbi:MAG: SagB/ThcOx family dehydrogenase [Halobacteriota archaeon]